MPIDDILSFIEGKLARLPPPYEEAAAVQSGVAITRFVAGMTDVNELRGELKALGYTGIRQDRYVLAAELRRQLDLFLDRLALWRDQLKSGELTQSEFATLLEDAGLPVDSVNLEMDRATRAKLAVVVKRVQVSLGILAADIVAPRPLEAPVQVSLGILEAEAVPTEAAGMSRVAVLLRIRAADLATAAAPLRPVAVFLGIIGVREV